MIKYLSSFILGLMLFPLVGCGGPSQEEVTPPEEQEIIESPDYEDQMTEGVSG
jgi:predicted small lipoprotein YifL